jgi:hypothetical protein
MWIGVRVALDRAHRDIPAADLRDHVGVLVLSPDRANLPLSGRGQAAPAAGGTDGDGQSEKGW